MTNVPSQRSSVSHFVPLTVAAPYLPLELKRPLPLPHSLRTRFFACVASMLNVLAPRRPAAAEGATVQPERHDGPGLLGLLDREDALVEIGRVRLAATEARGQLNRPLEGVHL